MSYGKTVELFLVNSTPDSLITAELSNWNGQAIKIPRIEVESCDRKDIKGTGVYFLICQDDDGSESVYIGEAECIYDRLCQHLRDYKSGKEKYYWNTAVIFIGRDLNKALIRYLEYRLVEIARDCGRYVILTKNTYKKTVLKDSQVASMEEFLENVRILIHALGYKVLVPAPQPTDKTQTLECASSSTSASAQGYVSAGGFTVVKGSRISDRVSPSFNSKGNYFKLRNLLIKDGIIVDNVFVCDYEFKAPSAASSVVLGYPSNGRSEWKTKDGTKLKDM